MSILRDYTNVKHREAEAKPFVQYLLHGNITKEQQSYPSGRSRQYK